MKEILWKVAMSILMTIFMFAMAGIGFWFILEWGF